MSGMKFLFYFKLFYLFIYFGIKFVKSITFREKLTKKHFREEGRRQWGLKNGRSWIRRERAVSNRTTTSEDTRQKGDVQQSAPICEPSDAITSGTKQK